MVDTSATGKGGIQHLERATNAKENNASVSRDVCNSLCSHGNCWIILSRTLANQKGKSINRKEREMAKPKRYYALKVNGNYYTFTLSENNDGTVTVLASGVIPFNANGEDDARKILRIVYTQWDAIRGQK